MKKNFKKLMSLMLVAALFFTMFCISTSAVARTITLKGGTRKLNSLDFTSTLNSTLLNLDGNTYTANDPNGNPVVYTIDKENHTVTFTTDDNGYFYFPEYFFVMTGHEQNAWGTSATSNAGNYKTERRLKATSNRTYYARYDTIKYEAEFLPGADGVGTAQTISNKTYGAGVTLPDAIFTRPGYVQIGWAFEDGATQIDYALNDTSFNITENVKFYPVWQKVIYNVTQDVTRFSFGSLCEGLPVPAAQTLTITNNGNSAVSFVLPTSTAYKVTASTTTISANGGVATVTIQPKANLAVGKYEETLNFDFGVEDVNVSVNAKFVVNEHLFVNYIYNNDATYSANGTETATCFVGCGATHTRECVGSKKVYLEENNTVNGLLEEYLYHKTVNITIYGSGMDDNEGIVGKRFRPVSWYVNEILNGEFAADETNFNVKYDHGDGNFGDYTLEVKYVEEEKNADGEWVATGVEDTNVYEYSIGPSQKDEQEVVRPNMIVSIIFALFGYVMDMLTSGSLF